MHRAICLTFLLGTWACAAEQSGVEEGFEGTIPDFHTYHATYVTDLVRAHTGQKSLRIDPEPGLSGGAYFRLDGVVDTSRDYEFSAWVWAGEDGSASLYISAAGEGRRFTLSRAAGGRPGAWVQLKGQVRRKQWEDAKGDIMLAMVTRSPSWFDDVLLRPCTLPDPPIEVWPSMRTALHAAADTRASRLSPGTTVTLNAGAAALAPDMRRVDVIRPTDSEAYIGRDGVLVFAVNTETPAAVDGTLFLEPADDLRPGLRAYVLGDNTVLAAPMVRASAWQSVGGRMTGPAPAASGEVPPTEVSLATWLLPAGRHYLAVAGPHFRAAGTFESLSLHISAEAPRPPLYEFALFSDTHLGAGASVWMNRKLNGAAGAVLKDCLIGLREEGVDFAIIAGDMTDGATRAQFQHLASVLRETRMPVYGCVGNHDAYHASARNDQLGILPSLFPAGRTHYTFTKSPLRFIVLDASYWRTPDGGFTETYSRGETRGIGIKPEQIDWLRQTLSADTTTPTVVVSHYPFFNEGGESSCGYMLSAHRDNQILDILSAAPNVVATLNGHTHWNSVDRVAGISCIQNAAFVEWPSMYRVFRVYDDALRWEVRLARNFGFVRESFIPAKALSWMISTGDGDLAGTVALERVP